MGYLYLLHRHRRHRHRGHLSLDKDRHNPAELIGYLIRSAILLRHFPDRDIYSAADKGAAYCDERVCLFLCVYLSLRGHIFGTTRPIFTKFFVHVTYTALARSPTGGVVISYVFPVLWMTSYFARGCSTSPPGLGSEAHAQPWSWCVGIPVAGSGRSRLLLAVRAY